MKIGVTLYPYGNSEPAGLNETIYRLSEALVKNCDEHKIVFFSKGTDLRPPAFIANTEHEFRQISKSAFWLDFAFYNNPDIDLWIYHTPMMPLFFKPKKSVVIALDFSYLYFEGGLRNRINSWVLKAMHGYAMHKANHIVSISEFTSEEVMRWFPSVGRQKITTIMAGYRDLKSITPEPFDVPENFYLCLGVVKPRKNQLRLVQAFIIAKQNGLKGSLIIGGSGSKSYLEKIQNTINNSEFGNDIIFTGYLSDGQVVYAYQNAKALVFPTLLEGFGFPVLEAMSLGTPVITSKTNSVGEISGDAAIKVDPESVEEITNALLAMQDIQTQEEYRKKGFEQCKKYSWDLTAQKLLQVVENI